MPYKEKHSQNILIPFIEESSLISEKRISNARTNRYAEIGSINNRK